MSMPSRVQLIDVGPRESEGHLPATVSCDDLGLDRGERRVTGLGPPEFDDEPYEHRTYDDRLN